MRDLLAATAALVDIPSVSLDERRLADHVEARLRAVEPLRVERIGDNVVARTSLGRSQRLVLAGHLDTVPANGNERARIDGEVLWGLGSADMKGGLAVFLELAETVAEPQVDLTFVFYVAEEIAAEHNGLITLFAQRPDLVRGDAAILGEPTDGTLEAGCQGTARLEVTLVGTRSHSARPWMGDNAIHRLAPLLDRLGSAPARKPIIDGCEYREAAQAVFVNGGVAGNVVPDRATLTVNLRFAPDRDLDGAVEAFRELAGDALGARDEIAVVDHAPAAAPALDHPLFSALAETGLETRAKLGWTDVARFAAHGIPAVNFGPGDSRVAHMADERVQRRSLDQVYAALDALVHGG